jgi:hypothetical protein
MYSEADLNAMTKAEIADLATALGYEGVSTADTKAVMIAAFIEAQGV